jgi:hypothetical protein
MVNEARAYRERVLSELARRRELAREQIEQLLHGRDRLMQSFERARLVAVDVVAELQPLGEPDEYVNLSPTTGPVPVMVPNSARPVDAPVVESPTVDELPVTDEVADAVPDAAEETEDAEPTPDDAADLEEATDATDVVEDAEVEDAEVEDAGVDAVAEDLAEEAVEEQPEAPRDDVVVDLFARLRADASLVEVDEFEEDIDEDVVEVVDEDAADGAVDETDEELVDEVVEEVVEDTPFDQRDADLTPLIVASAKKLKRVLADEQNEVLDRLRRREPVRSLSDLLPAPAEHLARYRGVIVDDLLASANAGASLVTPGRVARLNKSDAGAAVAAGESVLDEWLILPLRERLERCVNDGDGDNAGITKRVRAVYREWKTQHIDEQLDDVIRAAHGNGAYAALEPGTPVDWVSDRSHDVCADCDDNTLGGAVAAGEPFPTGHRFPPAHLGCRCLLLPAER